MRRWFLMLSILKAVVAFGQVPLIVDSITPREGIINQYQPLETFFNLDIEPKTLFAPAIHVVGNLSGSFSAQGRANAIRTVSKKVIYTPKTGYKANEKLQYMVSTGVKTPIGLPVNNPQVKQYRVAATSGEAEFGDSIIARIDFSGPNSLYQLADMDGDGDIDIVSYDSQGYLIVQLNKLGSWVGQYLFKVASGASFLHLADLQNDGTPDIILAFPNRIDIHFYASDILTLNPVSIAVKNTVLLDGKEGFVPISGDVDGDGDIDFVIGQGPFATVFKSNGNGTSFTETTITITGTTGNNVFLADMNEDGALDIVTQSGTYSGNDRFGNFPPFTNTAGNIIGVEEADMDDDGDMDLVQMSVATNGVLLRVSPFENGKLQQPRTFAVPLSKATAESITSGDFDADGFLDIAISSEGNAAFVVLLNDKKGGLLSPLYHYSKVPKRNILRLISMMTVT